VAPLRRALRREDYTVSECTIRHALRRLGWRLIYSRLLALTSHDIALLLQACSATIARLRLFPRSSPSSRVWCMGCGMGVTAR